MASCDDDAFPLLPDDTSQNPNFIHLPPPPPQLNPILTTNTVAAPDCSPAETDAGDGYGFPYENGSDLNRSRDEVSDGGTPYSYNKRARIAPQQPSGSGGDYRKDREEWSDTAISCLLDAYLDKFTQLNRGNLRGRDWEEVAATVSERCEKQSKTVEQCKNKVDNLKKRYKLERQRMTNGGISASHWPWFKKMEQIVGNSLPSSSKAVSDDDRLVSGSGASSARQSKRCWFKFFTGFDHFYIIVIVVFRFQCSYYLDL